MFGIIFNRTFYTLVNMIHFASFPYFQAESPGSEVYDQKEELADWDTGILQ